MEPKTCFEHGIRGTETAVRDELNHDVHTKKGTL